MLGKFATVSLTVRAGGVKKNDAPFNLTEGTIYQVSWEITQYLPEKPIWSFPDVFNDAYEPKKITEHNENF